MSDFLRPTLIALLIGFSVVGLSCDAEPGPIQVILPSDKWESIFFKEIDQVTKLAGLEELRKTNPKRDDVEVRVWQGFGISPLQGVILVSQDGHWTARHVKADAYGNPTKVEIQDLGSPKSGWQGLWTQVRDIGILTLPDASEIGCQSDQLDGIGYVVELNEGGKYRTYMYGDARCAESRQMKQIEQIIGLEFKELCERGEWGRDIKPIRSCE